jgi:branched-chain amino acid transport system ATP-binding protein
MELDLEKINTFYGLSHVLFDVSLNVKMGEVVVLLGRNGAGKTTTMLSVMGINPPKTGRITYRNKIINGLPSYKIARLGIGFVPEDRCIFPGISVYGNLDIGRKASVKNTAKWTLERIYQLFPALKKLSDRPGGTLSGGEQQMLTISRTLMGNPDFLLLDEPSEGLAPIVSKALGKVIDLIKKEELTILLSEQNTKFALKHADRAYILDNGTIKYQGSISELRQNEDIQKRFLAV